MMDSKYENQVRLLLRVAPEIAVISEFALHGGTAINLFHHNMPRLSVDVDLTYIPFGSREKDLSEISKLLRRLSERLKITIPGVAWKLRNIEILRKNNFLKYKLQIEKLERLFLV